MKKQPKKTPKGRSGGVFPLIVILLLSAFLRFFKLSELFHWTMDEEFWSYLPFNIATGYHFPLIGGHISGTGLYSGPLFVWLMAIPFWLVRGNPLGIAAFASTLGVITTLATFWVGKAMFDNKTGLLAALFSASSFLMVLYDRKYWNASPIPLLTLATIYCLFKISQKRYNWAYLLAIALVIAFHAHMTSGVLLLLLVISWLFFRLPIAKRAIVGAITIFVLLESPLVLFELRHDFTNTRALAKLFSQPPISVGLTRALFEIGKLTTQTLGRLVYMPPNRDIAEELTLCSGYQGTRAQPPFLAIGIALSGILFLITKRKETAAKLLVGTLMINILSLLWYRMRAPESSWYAGQLSEYFFLPSFPVVFLALGAFAKFLLKKSGRSGWIVLGGVAIMVALNLRTFLTAHHSDGFAKKREAVEQAIALVGSEPFTLTVESDDPCRLYGYRYLFSVYRKEPVQSYLDPQFLWLYEKRLNKQKPKKEVMISNISGTINVQVLDVPETDSTP